MEDTVGKYSWKLYSFRKITAVSFSLDSRTTPAMVPAYIYNARYELYTVEQTLSSTKQVLLTSEIVPLFNHYLITIPKGIAVVQRFLAG